MNKDMLMWIVFGIGSMTHTSCVTNTTPGCGASHQFRSARVPCDVLHMELS
jgi:predicted small secreted protein